MKKQTAPPSVKNPMWFMFIATIFTFAAVAYISSPDSDPEVIIEATSLFIPFALAAGFIGLLSFVVPIFLRPLVAKQAASNPQMGPDFLPFIISMAFSEAVGMIGLFYSMQEENFYLYLPFGLVSLILILMRKPKN